MYTWDKNTNIQPFDVEGTSSKTENERQTALRAFSRSQIQQRLHGHALAHYESYTFRPSFFEYITVSQSGI